MNRRSFLKITAAAVLSTSAAGCSAMTGNNGGKKPNIIVILTDDLGWGDLSCYPQQRNREGVAIDTPNIDALASSGVRCTDAYATCCICAPSRAGLMAGRYQQHFGYYEFYETLAGIPKEEKTIAELLKENGYSTAMFGKWHISQYEGPLDKGFDRFYGHLYGQHDYYDPRNGDNCLGISHAMDSYIMDQRTPIKGDTMEYLTDTLTDKTVDFIDRQSGTDKPFFIYLAYTAPHPPLQAKWEKLEKYYPKKDKGFSQRDLARAMIDSVDEGITKIIDGLKKTGAYENTLIFFSSDNGGHDDGPGKALVQHNGGLRSRKGYLWEGGIRVPMIVSWPAKIKPGLTFTKPVSHLDIYATSAAAAGITDMPANKDGANLVPYLNNEMSEQPHEALFWGFAADANRWAVRKGDWKLVRECPSPEAWLVRGDIRETALFNLADDPSEKNNLLDKHPDKAKELFELKDGFYQKSKPTLVTEQMRNDWQKEYKERMEKEPNPNALRRDGYPGCWK